MTDAAPATNRRHWRQLHDLTIPIPPRTVIHGAVHTQLRVKPAHFTKVDFVDCALTNTDFYGSEFTHVTFVNCELNTVHMGPVNCSDVTFTDCVIIGDFELYASYLDRVTASPEFWSQVKVQGAYLRRGSDVPPGYKTRPATAQDLAENRKARWINTSKSRIIRDGLEAPAPADSNRGHLIYDVLEYDLEALGPHAEFLLKEHPRIPTGKLRALAGALALA